MNYLEECNDNCLGEIVAATRDPRWIKSLTNWTKSPDDLKWIAIGKRVK